LTTANHQASGVSRLGVLEKLGDRGDDLEEASNLEVIHGGAGLASRGVGRRSLKPGLALYCDGATRNAGKREWNQRKELRV